MAVNLGELARKLLVNPIVAVGKAVGSDYKNTVFGPDWRERAIMRRRMAEAKLAESAARTAADIEQTDYNRRAKEATASLTDERTAALRRRARVDEARAAESGLSVEEYLAREARKDDDLRRALREAETKRALASSDLMGATQQGKLAWLEAGGPESVVLRNQAGAAASQHRAEAPYTTGGSRGPRLPNDKYMLLDLALQTGDRKELAQQLGSVSREQLVNTVGESHPLVDAYDRLKSAAPAPAPSLTR